MGYFVNLSSSNSCDKCPKKYELCESETKGNKCNSGNFR